MKKRNKIIFPLLALMSCSSLISCSNKTSEQSNMTTTTTTGTTSSEDTTTSTTEEIVTIVSVELKTLPAKTVYIPGENFDPTGMVIEVTYSNNTKANADLSTCTFSEILEDSTKVIVSYEGFEVEVPITVEDIFDPSTYAEGLTKVKNDSIEKLEAYLSSFENYSNERKAEIEQIIEEGKQAIQSAATANQVIDYLYTYEGKIDAVPNLKQEKGLEFISLMSGETTTTGYNSKDMVSVDKTGKVVFYSKMNWGQINFGSTSNNQYKVFDCDITIDYESNTWGSCNLFINYQSSYNNYDVLLKHSDSSFINKVNNADTYLQTGKGFADMKKYHLQVITNGTRKIVLQDDELIFDIDDSTYNVGRMGFSLWQTALYFENYKYKEYENEEALKAEYSAQLEKELPKEEVLDAKGFLDKYCSDQTNYEINENDEIVCSTGAYNRHSFGESSNNNFETFEFDLVPTFNTSSSYLQIDFRKQDDNRKYVIVLLDGSIRIDRRRYDGKQIRDTVVPTYTTSEITSGKKLHFKILCSGWYKTVALNGKHLYTNGEDKEYCSGPFGIDAGSTPYILANPVINKYATQNDLVAKNPDLWASSYKEEFVK